MTFNEWLKTKRNEDSPIGDFANDWFNDKTHPKSDSFPKIFNYLANEKNMTSPVREVFADVYKEYIDYYIYDY